MRHYRVCLLYTSSSRLQPNHTTDDPKGIMASVMEGLSLGCGDAVIGLNPVDDSVESVARVLRSFDAVSYTHLTKDVLKR